MPPRVFKSWVIVSLMLGVLIGAGFATIVISIQANHQLKAQAHQLEVILQVQTQAAQENRAASRCALHTLVEGQRTILLAIRELLERPNPSPELQEILNRFTAHIAQLVPVDTTGFNCS